MWILPPSDGGDIAGEGCFPIWERNFEYLGSDGFKIESNGWYPAKNESIIIYIPSNDNEQNRIYTLLYVINYSR